MESARGMIDSLVIGFLETQLWLVVMLGIFG